MSDRGLLDGVRLRVAEVGLVGNGSDGICGSVNVTEIVVVGVGVGVGVGDGAGMGAGHAVAGSHFDVGLGGAGFGRAPAFAADVGVNAETDSEGSVATAGTPGPTGTLADGEVVPAEGKPADDGTQDGAEEDVGAVVTEIGVARGRDVGRSGDGSEGDDQEVGGRCGGLVTERDVGAGWQGRG